MSVQYDSQRKMSNNASNKQSHLEKENAQLREEIQKVEKNIKVNQQSLNDVKQYGRRECVEIAGVLVMEKENTKQVAIKFFKKINVDAQPYEITACHRVPAKTGQPKIICKLLNRKTAGRSYRIERK